MRRVGARGVERDYGAVGEANAFAERGRCLHALPRGPVSKWWEQKRRFSLSLGVGRGVRIYDGAARESVAYWRRRRGRGGIALRGGNRRSFFSMIFESSSWGGCGRFGRWVPAIIYIISSCVLCIYVLY